MDAGHVQTNFGDLEHPAGEISINAMPMYGLECPAREKTCKVVEATPNSVLYTAKSGGKPMHTAVVHLQFDDKTPGECQAESRNLADARRLLRACESLSGQGFARPGTAVVAPLAADEADPRQDDVAKAPKGPAKLVAPKKKK